jgi:hypothetical protein
MRKSDGFRTYRVLELALYHSLGKLPEPESTRFLLTNQNFSEVSFDLMRSTVASADRAAENP